MAPHPYELVVIGGSAGSIAVALELVPALSDTFTLPIVFVLHRKASTKPGFLAHIIQHRITRHIKEADEKEKILPSTVYIAPADYHLLLEDDETFSLDASEKVLFSRPSINVTFESAAANYGPRLIGILLTGANSDGANGIQEIARQGGLTIAQNPLTAEMAVMPQAAIDTGHTHRVMTVPEIVYFLNSLNA